MSLHGVIVEQEPSHSIPDASVFLSVSLSLSLCSASSVAGLLVLGYLSDRLSARLLIAISCFGASLACLFLWGFATQLGMLLAFAFVFGFFGLGEFRHTSCNLAITRQCQ